jgi:hypothetical protein
MQLKELRTGRRNRATENLDTMTALELVSAMNREDAAVPRAMKRALPDIAKAVDAIAQSFVKGGRLIASSGAALVNSPKIVRRLRRSGGYTGAKRTLWLMAHLASSLSDERNLGIRFQVLVPLQMVGNTRFLQHIAGAFARREGISLEAHLEARYGKPFSECEYARQVVALLSDERYSEGIAFGFRSHSDTVLLDQGR